MGVLIAGGALAGAGRPLIASAGSRLAAEGDMRHSHARRVREIRTRQRLIGGRGCARVSGRERPGRLLHAPSVGDGLNRGPRRIGSMPLVFTGSCMRRVPQGRGIHRVAGASPAQSAAACVCRSSARRPRKQATTSAGSRHLEAIDSPALSQRFPISTAAQFSNLNASSSPRSSAPAIPRAARCTTERADRAPATAGLRADSGWGALPARVWEWRPPAAR